jgi:uncharacterized protein YdaL
MTPAQASRAADTVAATFGSTPDPQSAKQLTTGISSNQILSGYAAAALAAQRQRAHGAPSPVPITETPPPVDADAAVISTQSSARSAQSITGTGALVLYDTTGQYGFLGELYAMGLANLAGHFGTFKAEPIQNYTAGQMNGYAATFYIGSNYYEPYDANGNYSAALDTVPAAFYTDVAKGTNPVLWMGFNIWNMADAVGVSAFTKQYGWDPTQSYSVAADGTVGDVTSVTYQSRSLTRTYPPGTDGGVVRPFITKNALVTKLAHAIDTSTSPSTSFPWAIRSSNLTYIGEIPFDYVTESDRVIALEDMLFDFLAPNTATRHRAMVRLEDLNANTDPVSLMKVAQLLVSKGIPFGFNLIPLYTDPLGHYNNGVPQTIPWPTPSPSGGAVTTSGYLNSLAKAKASPTPSPVPTTNAQAVAAVVNYMLANGGVMIDEGYTHQYSNVANPYDGVTADDAEFYLAHVDANNYVIWDGPVPGDSTAWAAGRVQKAVAAYQAAGWPVPQLWVTPHYFATDLDYAAISAQYPARYERSVYYEGDLSTGTATNYQQLIGEFFPYVVKDIYGTWVLPENLGDYEPVSLNHNPIRTAADIVSEAKKNLAVRDGFASFFYDADYGTGPITTMIDGVQSAGYTFVAPSPSLR